jgi:peptidoglycan-binding protein ArfA
VGDSPESSRRSIGLSWLIGLVIIPLLIAAIGYGALDRAATSTGPTGALPTLTQTSTSGVPKLSLAPLSITRNGNDITLNGDFPDDSAKAILMKALRGGIGPTINVIDQIRINPNVDALDFSNAQPIFQASSSIPNFTLSVDGDTVTLAGTASSADQKNTIDQATTRAWSNLNIVDNLAVNGPPPPPGATPVPADPCVNLQASLNSITGGPVTFGNDGFSLTPNDEQILGQVADKLKACPAAHVTINGYTDDTGTEAINIPLSSQRAGTVADFLASNGISRDRVATKGLGSINPVAGNDTADGRAKNRRAEIVVS